jgi:DMSO/TMAO reductase YedYZ heme-binding membrane subunit
MNKRPYIISTFIIVALIWYYFIYNVTAIDLDSINKIMAYSAVYLIGFAILLGPLTRLIPSLNFLIADRKPLGLMGFGFVVMHIIVLVFHLLEESKTVTTADMVSLVFAGLAFMILTLMALTSTPKWVTILTFENWKSLHRMGYLALAFILVHILLTGMGKSLTEATGKLAIILIAVVLTLKTRELLKNRGIKTVIPPGEQK